MTHKKRAPKRIRKPKTEADAIVTRLDPSHPNHDAILLRQARLESYRKRRRENALAATPVTRAQKPGRRKTRSPES